MADLRRVLTVMRWIVALIALVVVLAIVFLAVAGRGA
jgi:uncharacterized membrane-anchored protein YhcB (DUF1043 family)